MARSNFSSDHFLLPRMCVCSQQHRVGSQIPRQFVASKYCPDQVPPALMQARKFYVLLK
jgi:hypothetical protein